MEVTAPHHFRTDTGKRAFVKGATNTPLSFINAVKVEDNFLRATQYCFYDETPVNSTERSDQITIRNTSSDDAPLRTVTDFYPVTGKVKHKLEAFLQKTRFNVTAIVQSGDSETSVLPPEAGALYNQQWKCLLLLHLYFMYLVPFIWSLSPWLPESAMIQLKPLICNLKCSLVSSLSCAYWACISRKTIHWVLCHLHQEQCKSPQTTLHVQLHWTNCDEFLLSCNLPRLLTPDTQGTHDTSAPAYTMATTYLFPTASKPPSFDTAIETYHVYASSIGGVSSTTNYQLFLPETAGSGSHSH